MHSNAMPAPYTAQLAGGPAAMSRRARCLAARAERRRVHAAKAALVVAGVIVEVTRDTDADSFRLFVTAVRPLFPGGPVRVFGYEVNERGRQSRHHVRAAWLSANVMYAVRTPRRGTVLALVSDLLLGRAGRHRITEVTALDTLAPAALSGGDEHAAARSAWAATTSPAAVAGREYDDDDCCVRCGAHIADPHVPGFPCADRDDD